LASVWEEKEPGAQVIVDSAQRSINQEIRTAVRHSAVYGLGNMMTRAIGFLMLPLYTHYLSPQDYGILEILDLSMSLVGMFLNMGIMAALLRFYNQSKTDADKRRVVSTAFQFVIATGLATWLLAALFARPISSLLFSHDVPAKYFTVYFTSFTLGYITSVPNSYLQAKEASTTLALADILTLLSILTLNVYFIAVLKIGLIGILVSPLLTGIIRATIFAFWTIREVGFGLDWSRLRGMLGFGAPLIFSNLAMFTLNFSDRFFLQHLRSLDIVGIYAVGYKFGYMLNLLLIQPFLLMWQARMYLIQERADRDAVFGRIFILYSSLLLFGALALSLFSHEIVRVMVDARFAPSQGIIPVVAFAYVAYGIASFFQGGLLLAGRTYMIGMSSAFAALFNLGLNYILISRYGMMGAGWATVLSFLAIAVGNGYFSWSNFTGILRVGRFQIALLVAVVLYLLSLSLNFESVLAVLAKVTLLAAFPIVMVTCVFSPQEREALISIKDSVFSKGTRLLGLAARRAGV